ncbi:MAG: pyridoxamine 5'-phosphate oxidase family protein [Candidatus Bathyarchaeota archaeon]|nr:pyridoxamine 5'-phosphate oxidase family protein [Candidatus Bathyarchaeota archaeon]
MSSMRRKDKEITEKVILEEILLENQVGRLGTAVDGVPYVVPMNYGYRDGKIYLHTHKDGKKIKDIQKNPRVCFEVDSGEMIVNEDPCDFSWDYRSVIANGTAKIIDDPEKKLEALRIISDKYSFGKGQKLTQEQVNKFPILYIIEITINEMKGKRSPA